jgi:hypothetical protein
LEGLLGRLGCLLKGDGILGNIGTVGVNRMSRPCSSSSLIMNLIVTGRSEMTIIAVIIIIIITIIIIIIIISMIIIINIIIIIIELST